MGKRIKELRGKDILKGSIIHEIEYEFLGNRTFITDEVLCDNSDSKEFKKVRTLHITEEAPTKFTTYLKDETSDRVYAIKKIRCMEDDDPFIKTIEVSYYLGDWGLVYGKIGEEGEETSKGRYHHNMWDEEEYKKSHADDSDAPDRKDIDTSYFKDDFGGAF